MFQYICRDSFNIKRHVKFNLNVCAFTQSLHDELILSSLNSDPNKSDLRRKSENLHNYLKPRYVQSLFSLYAYDDKLSQLTTNQNFSKGSQTIEDNLHTIVTQRSDKMNTAKRIWMYKLAHKSQSIPCCTNFIRIVIVILKCLQHFPILDRFTLATTMSMVILLKFDVIQTPI